MSAQMRGRLLAKQPVLAASDINQSLCSSVNSFMVKIRVAMRAPGLPDKIFKRMQILKSPARYATARATVSFQM